MNTKKCSSGTLISSILLLTFIVFPNRHAFTQETGPEFIIFTGADFTEVLHLGMGLEGPLSRIGFSYGTTFSAKKEYSLSAHYARHFAGKPRYDIMHPWYGKMMLSYLYFESSTWKSRDYYLGPRIGRDFWVNPSLNLRAEAGAMFRLSHQTEELEGSSGWNLDISFPVLPALGIALVWRPLKSNHH